DGGLKNAGRLKAAPALVVRRTPSSDATAMFPGSVLLITSIGSTGDPPGFPLIAPRGTSGRFAGNPYEFGVNWTVSSVRASRHSASGRRRWHGGRAADLFRLHLRVCRLRGEVDFRA